MKIMLDAGHGRNTPGKRSPDGLREFEFNSAVADYAKELLENYKNTTIYFAHSNNEDVPLQARTDKANRLDVDIYVAIHANAFGTGGWNDAGGIETYVYPTKPAIAYQLAQKIQRNLVIATGLRNRGVKTADFHVLRETKMDAVLVECGFMTNPDEVKLLSSGTYRQTCAEAIAKALADQYRLKPKSDKEAKTGSGTKQESTGGSSTGGSGRLYKVQAGAFKERKNAEAVAEQLRKAGFKAFIYPE
ncbi:N-acetylmuramoyl-L-alanine amidase [Bacillus sp. REN3]|uniref:N-acetylmuramoyl-L-alanine amidase n=1 Tax=Bacillus sp. REN3 TaxID=2802440 RepID=UPI001AEF222E|nr:N-acetylmuramoyl-L-alanine amidase [Bacillus sp. REN3]